MFGYETRLLTPPKPEDCKRIEAFLGEAGLAFEGSPDLAVVLEDHEGHIVATGSLDGNVIKMMAVAPDMQDAGLSGKVISRIIEQAGEMGRTHLFVFTRPASADKFVSFGFRELARYEPEASLLEMGQPGVDAFRTYLRSVKKQLPGGARAGGVVVNCNPFTLGHRYLIEQAASRCDHLYAVVVETDLSSFPFEDRMDLVRGGLADLENVTVVRSGEYAVSPATFPSYFMKGASIEGVAAVQARLDVTLFANLFVPELDISCRFVGTEPYCPVTGSFNEAMKEILPSRGVELFEIQRRVLDDGTIVSASTVRAMIREDKWDEVRRLVPEVTWNYLRSEKAVPVIEHLLATGGRH
ncbi:MAG: [citrate (pro-3S)-lyase] ligase [Synergistota bacterium]|nr:[citrate (pro-3S)-lyase] ligase [Synergistota bacterium]